MIKITLKALATIFIALVVFFAWRNILVSADSKESDIVRDIAYHSAEIGFEDIAQNSIKLAPFSAHRADINSSLAYLAHKNGDESRVEDLKISKDFDLNSYESRAIVFDIQKEPAFMQGLLEDKFLPRIQSLPNLSDRILPFYALAQKMGSEGDKYKTRALKILESTKVRVTRTNIANALLQKTLKNGDAESLFKVASASYAAPANDILVFKALKQKAFFNYIKKNPNALGKNEYLKRFLSAESSLKKRDFTELEPKIRYMPLRYGYEWICGSLADFNIPTIALIAKLHGLDDIADEYILRAISPEILQKNARNSSAYLPYLAAVLVEFNRPQDALKLALNYPQDREAIFQQLIKSDNAEILCEILKSYEP